MLNFRKILFFAAFSGYAIMTCSAQNVKAADDPSKIIQKKTETKKITNNQQQNGNLNKEMANTRNNASNKGIKQVKSARPDMSKARGARPPQIERPAGSRIPRGVGRPGGAFKPGKR